MRFSIAQEIPVNHYVNVFENDLFTVRRSEFLSEVRITSKHINTYFYDLCDNIIRLLKQFKINKNRKDTLILENFSLKDECFKPLHKFYQTDKANIYLIKCRPDNNFVIKLRLFADQVEEGVVLNLTENITDIKNIETVYFFDLQTKIKISQYDSSLFLFVSPPTLIEVKLILLECPIKLINIMNIKLH